MDILGREFWAQYRKKAHKGVVEKMAANARGLLNTYKLRKPEPIISSFFELDFEDEI